MVSVLAIGSKFAGLYPAEDDGFLRLIEIPTIFSFGGEINPEVP
jgi:hypothetical protein